MHSLIFAASRDVSFASNVTIYFGSWADLHIHVADR